jgi:hypothetical protein
VSKPIYEIVDELPKGGLTVMSLRALDTFVPDQWNNLVGFDNTIRSVTGATDEGLIQQIGERAIALYNDSSQGYQRALWLYETVDTASGLLGTVALANRVGQDTFLKFLQNVTPRPEKAQSIDLAIKLVTEVVAFCNISGIPGDSLGDFFAALNGYKDEALIRMVALACYDGIIPLGPDFTERALSVFSDLTPEDLERNLTFRGVKKLIPGGDTAGQLGFIQQAMGGSKGWLDNFVHTSGVTREGLLGNLKGFVEFTSDKADYVGALLDMYVKYYRHTGIQTLARRLVERAVAEI